MPEFTQEEEIVAIQEKIVATTLGIRKYKKAQQEALERGRMTSQGSGASLLASMVPMLSGAIKEACDFRKRNIPGPRPRGLIEMRKLSPNVLAVLAARTVLECLITKDAATSIAIQIGVRVEDELKCLHFRRGDRRAYKQALERVGSSQAYAYKHKAMTAVMNKCKTIKPWASWSQRLKLQVGTTLLDLMLTTTGSIRRDRREGKYVIVLTDEFENAMKSQDARLELLLPTWGPSALVPVPWAGPMGGGYHLCDDYPVVRKDFMGRPPELGAAPVVYQALNRIQETAWKVNEAVLETVKELFQHEHLALPQIPSRVSDPGPARPVGLPVDLKKADMDEVELELLRTYRYAKRRNMEEQRRSASRLLRAQAILATAEEQQRIGSKFYFPHNLDWRGRAYSIASVYCPQGSDLARGLLEFADGKPIGTEAGSRWFCITGANHFGIDKVSYDARVDWVVENEPAILEVASDPVSNHWWMQASEPYQFLAWCLEYGEWHESGFDLGYVSHKVCGQDGSCNGLQHFSAMQRDPVGGRAVNLTACPAPQDIYQDVLDEVIVKLERLAPDRTPEGRLARIWLATDLLERKIVKSQVMTRPYGSTRHGMHTKLENYLCALEDEGQDLKLGDVHTWEASRFLTNLIFDTIAEVVIGANEVMEWLMECARIAYQQRKRPMRWSTPHGFNVYQAYRNVSKEVVKCQLAGSVRLSLQLRKKTLSLRRQVSGTSPNFIHALDACHMTETVAAMPAKGVSWAVVHDSFGCHAVDCPLLAVTLREEFVRLYEENDVLGAFKRALETDLGITLPDPPKPGGLDLWEVLKSDFFFA